MRPRIAITLEMSIREERRLNYLDLAYARSIEEAGGLALYFPSLPFPGKSEEILSMIDGLILTGGQTSTLLTMGKKLRRPSVFLRISGRILTWIFSGDAEGRETHPGDLSRDADHEHSLGGNALPGSCQPGTRVDVARAADGQPPARHRMQVEPGSRLAEVLGGMLEFEVVSTHHQAVKGLGKDVRASAKSPDGLVEGIEVPGNPRAIGIQWHPEKDPTSESSRRIFRALIEMTSSSARV